MAYRNFSRQTRPTIDQPWYWEVRPYGNPFPTSCHDVEDFYYNVIIVSPDRLSRTVETVWKDKQAFLNTLPPDVYEQPMFDQWHADHGMTFMFEEDENFEHDPAMIGNSKFILEEEPTQ